MAKGIRPKLARPQDCRRYKPIADASSLTMDDVEYGSLGVTRQTSGKSESHGLAKKNNNFTITNKTAF